jgi:hypothetical protein
VRLVVRPDFRERLFGRFPRPGRCLTRCWCKAGDPEDQHRFRHLWKPWPGGSSPKCPGGQVLIQPQTLTLPGYARGFATDICSRCHEGVMESRIRMQGGQKVCLACAGEEYYQLTGQGIGWGRDL